MKKTAFLLVGIIIVATFLRLHHFTTTPPGLYPDEAVNAYNAVTANQTGSYRVFYPENNGREGLFMNIQAMSLKLFGVNEPWSLRFPSALFGILTVLGIFFLARELFDDRIALLSAFFAATNFWHINFSRIGFRAIMAPFFLTAALFFLLWAIRKSREGLPLAKAALIAIAGGTFFGLGFYSYISYRTAPLLLLPIIYFFRTHKNFWKVLGIFLVTTFFVALPIGIYYLQHPADFLGRTSQVSIFSSEHPLQILGFNILKTIGMFFVYGDGNWRHNYAGAPELFWPVSLVFLIGIVLTIRALRSHESRKQFSGWFLTLWALLMALPVATSNEGIPHALRAIVMVPVVMIMAGWGGIALYDFLEKKYHNKLVLRIPLVIILTLLVFQPYDLYFNQWAPKPEVASAFNADITAMARTIRDMPRTAPIYIVADGGGIDAHIADAFAPGRPSRTVGFPLASQVIMFITDTFRPEDQIAKQIFYVTPDEAKDIPPQAARFNIH